MSVDAPAMESHSLGMRLVIRLFLLSIRRRYLYLAIGVVLGILGLISSAQFWTELLWYRSLGYLEIYLTILQVRIGLGAAAAALIITLIVVNMRAAVRLSPLDRIISSDETTVDHWRRWLTPFTRPIIATIALVIGLIFGFWIQAHWETWMLWENQVPWGRTDPQFDRDLSYFMFQLPLLTLINSVLFWALLITIILTAITSYIFGGIRPQAPGSKLPPAVNLHFSLLFAALIGVIGWGLLLELHMLSYSERGVITGLGFTDSNASLVAYQFIATGCVVLFILFQVNIRKPGWLLPTIAMIWLFLLGLSLARGYPNLYQLLVVEPQELEREEPYIEDHLGFTRYGFDLHDVRRVRSNGDADAEDVDELDGIAPTLSSLRLWDEDTLRVVYEELQTFRSYYRFPDVDTDRYPIDGTTRQVMVGAREVDVRAVPEGSRTWQNQHLIYTHGHGVTATAVAGHTPAGLPTFVAQAMPTVGAGSLQADNPRVYFGDGDLPYAIVGSSTVELDHPLHDVGFEPHTYDGDAGVHVHPLLRRLAFAIRFWELRIPLSRLIEPDSRVVWHRNVRERVELAAPFLEVDQNPYPVVVDGRIKWVVEAYTTSDMLPYSKRVDLHELTRLDQRSSHWLAGDVVPEEFVRRQAGLEGIANYIRNSVKAVVDAYDGSVTLYVVDPTDRVLQAWMQEFPEHFVPVAEASDELRAHFRYPEDLFRVQAIVWSDFHMRDAPTFYAKEASWRIPPDASFISDRRDRATNEDRLADLRPYYLHTRIPGEDDEEFVVVQLFTPADRDVLTGYLIGRSDGDAYGELVGIEFPPNSTVLGPAQAQARIDQDPVISGWTTLRMQSGSRVARGRLVLQPIGDSLLYLQPLFVQADKSEVSELLGAQLSSIPELTKVVGVWGDRVVMRDTLPQVIDALFDADVGELDVPGQPAIDVPSPPPDTGGARGQDLQLPQGSGPQDRPPVP